MRLRAVVLVGLTAGASTPPAVAAAVEATRHLAPTGSAFVATADVTPARPAVGSRVTIRASVTAKRAPANDVIVQINVYASAGGKVFHEDVGHQAFAAGQARVYVCAWRPTAAGAYTVKIGTFSRDWHRNYYWNDNANRFIVN